MNLRTKHALIAAAVVAAPSIAMAHTSADPSASLAHGFVHPVGGIDHLLAMIAVGTLAFILGGRARWLVPVTFVVMMALGGLLGMQGVTIPFVEVGIAVSVIVLGLALSLRWKAPTAAAMATAGLFAIFHGHAHGAEMPFDAAGLSYAFGFMAATVLLHGLGIGLGAAVSRTGSLSVPAMRLGGGAITLTGLALLGGAL